MIRGVRGATTVTQNDENEIVNSTEELIKELIEQNAIEAANVASVFISVTADINAEFPAKALRRFSSWKYVPVMCMKEINVKGSLPLCIRVMIHVNTDKAQQDIIHIYLKDAVTLRPDLIKE
ncbi:chorismate mutase [Heyndrickxia oleronia]|uniref:chorismate mutase n=1 Tax=Heyndrickxia TaxID=2837504 RepID=UPI001B102B2E|nr:chorismate mutase [Heyndrickxia oleronia]MCM3236817.1 chorismate mutase [Heyndrickxia oleronia]GIN38183.1 chorismate mutase [Heyndrickxia oleronia]